MRYYRITFVLSLVFFMACKQTEKEDSFDELKNSNKEEKTSLSSTEFNKQDYFNSQTKDYKFIETFDKFPLSADIKMKTKGTKTKEGDYYINTDYVNELENNLGCMASIMDPSKKRKAHRAEIHYELTEHYQKNKVHLSFNFLVPSDYKIDLENAKREVMIFQIHSKPDKGSTWKDYQQNLPFNRPAIAIFMSKQQDKYYLILRYGLNGKEEKSFDGFKWFVAGVKEIAPNEWNKIVLSYKLSLTNTGYIRAWLNDQYFTPFNGKNNKVFGANMHNNALPYLKMGLYRYWHDSNKHEVFYDNLIISNDLEDLLNEDQIKNLNAKPSVNEHN